MRSDTGWLRTAAQTLYGRSDPLAQLAVLLGKPLPKKENREAQPLTLQVDPTGVAAVANAIAPELMAALGPLLNSNPGEPMAKNPIDPKGSPEYERIVGKPKPAVQPKAQPLTKGMLHEPARPVREQEAFDTRRGSVSPLSVNAQGRPVFGPGGGLASR